MEFQDTSTQLKVFSGEGDVQDTEDDGQTVSITMHPNTQNDDAGMGDVRQDYHAAMESLTLYCKLETHDNSNTGLYSLRHDVARRIRMIMKMPASVIQSYYGTQLREPPPNASLNDAMADAPEMQRLPIQELSDLAQQNFPDLTDGPYNHREEFRIPAHNTGAVHELIDALQKALSEPVIGTIDEEGTPHDHIYKIVG